MQDRVRSLPLQRRSDPDSDQKLGELILYIASCCESDPRFGATKLNKILYFADSLSYTEYGEPITGAQYMKEAKGPVPVRFLPVREKLKASGDIAVQQRPFFGHPQTRIIPLRQPNLELFRSRDIALVDHVIRALRFHNATTVSEFTHDKKPWQIARLRENIPYSAILLSEDAVTEDDVLEAQFLIRKHGWQDV
jgi:uncharacterized phage-associated protein